MPSDSGMAFVALVHLSQEHESNLAGILQACTLNGSYSGKGDGKNRTWPRVTTDPPSYLPRCLSLLTKLERLVRLLATTVSPESTVHRDSRRL
jgi:hypothetical protein